MPKNICDPPRRKAIGKIETVTHSDAKGEAIEQPETVIHSEYKILHKNYFSSLHFLKICYIYKRPFLERENINEWSKF